METPPKPEVDDWIGSLEHDLGGYSPALTSRVPAQPPAEASRDLWLEQVDAHVRGSVGKNAAALSGADTVGSVLAQKTDGLEQQLDGLLTRAAELASLRERLNQVDELSSRTGAQVDALQKSRADLETFHEEIHAFHTSRAEIMGAAEQLAADRTAFEGFVQRVDDFQKRLPGLESKMDAITAKAAVVDEQTKRVSTLVAMSDDLDLQVTRIEGHKQTSRRSRRG